MTDVTPPFGEWLTAARIARKLTLEQLAAESGLNKRTIREIENGKRPNPSQRTRDKLKRALDTAPDREELKGEDGADRTTALEAYGEWLSNTRSAKRLTREELAQESGLGARTIREIENGKRNPSVATRKKLEDALGSSPPAPVRRAVEKQTTIEGVGPFADFDPHDPEEMPREPGVYVFYDISERPIYIGESGNIRNRIRGSHVEKFWYRRPIVEKASYVCVADEHLRRQLEDTLIKFLKSNAVINRRQVDR